MFGHAQARERPSGVHSRSASFASSSLSGSTLSASTFMAALGAASDGVLLIDRAGTIAYANPAAEAFLNDECLVGRCLSDVWLLDRPTLSGIWRSLRAGRWCGRLPSHAPQCSGMDLEPRAEEPLEVTVQRVGGEAGTAEHFCVVLHGAGRAEPRPQRPVWSSAWSSLPHAHASATHSTSETSTNQRRKRSETLATLQRVASEIAHDFNNQIAVVLNYTFVLLREMPPDSPLKEHITEMQAAAWRASQAARSIRSALLTRAALPSGK